MLQLLKACILNPFHLHLPFIKTSTTIYSSSKWDNFDSIFGGITFSAKQSLKSSNFSQVNSPTSTGNFLI
ncbi:hypothetical protein CISIN_1g035260mg [Citrus sinensis]|uniref:Uncharacterized protein n=1 Tax=Citrus sinensis TaxID=2711 RepID=A0A067D2C2_CITSI|nr:hypothetical protein CISIN_1g035260mg [Citrus sinensis]